MKIRDGAKLPADLELPLQVKGDYDYYMTEIEDDVFSGQKDLRSVVLPPTLERIGDRAFCGCSRLERITIGYSCSHIGADAFAGCDALEEVRIADIFKQCEIWLDNEYSNPMIFAKKVYIKDELLGDTLEIPSAPERLIFSQGVTEVGSYAFAGCKIKTLRLG